MDSDTRAAGLRILVCGGRDFSDRTAVFAALDRLHSERGIAVLIHGAARGADTLAAAWAQGRGVPTQAYPADWQAHGRSAGPLRNRRMLEEGLPDGVVAFPGGRGTADMISAARRAGVKVWEPRGPSLRPEAALAGATEPISGPPGPVAQ